MNDKKTNPLVFLSAIAVLTPGHLRFLSAILSDLSNQTLKFSEIIIVCSGFKPEDFDSVVRKVRPYNLNDEIIQLIQAKPGSAGQNRNIGLDAVSDKAVLVLIHDADDRYPSFRNQRIYEQYRKTEFDALLHLFLPTNELGADGLLEYMNNFQPDSDTNWGVLTPRQLYQQTFEFGIRKRREEELAILDTSLKLPATHTKLLVHHAHVTLKRESTRKFRYHEDFFPRNEDGLLVRDLLFSGLGVFVLCQPLSVYMVGSSTFSAKTLNYKSVLFWKRSVYLLSRKVGSFFRSKRRNSKP